jgi:hypothetical protein
MARMLPQGFSRSQTHILSFGVLVEMQGRSAPPHFPSHAAYGAIGHLEIFPDNGYWRPQAIDIIGCEF